MENKKVAIIGKYYKTLEQAKRAFFSLPRHRWSDLAIIGFRDCFLIVGVSQIAQMEKNYDLET